jgi:hypothetical protein
MNLLSAQLNETLDKNLTINLHSLKQFNSFTVVGDFCPAGPAIEAAFKASSASPWSKLRDLVGPSALIIGNLECVISDQYEGRPFKYANLRVSSDLAWLTDGLDLAVIGNNHISDFGPNGVNDTIRALSQRGILSVGYGVNIKHAIRPQIVEVGRKQLGIISLCCPTTNGENLATHWTEGVPPLGMALLCDAVRAGKQQCDALLVFLHWGCEHVHDPVPDQVRLARRAIDAGADAVVGCHSHTIQSYECYKGHWIFYGLGNFLFGPVETQQIMGDGTVRRVIYQPKARNRESIAAEFSIVPDEGSGRLRLERVQALVFGDDYVPQPVTKEQLTVDLDILNRRLADYSKTHERELSATREPTFRSGFRNGILTYFYCDEPINVMRESSVFRVTKRVKRAFRNLVGSLTAKYSVCP